MSKIKPEEFVKKAALKHGGRYDYSQSVYLGTGENVTIICRIHGAFEQNASNHIRGGGCPKCFSDGRRKAGEKAFFECIKDMYTAEHYDYSLVDYKNIDTDIKIVCPTHGIFTTTPYRHMNGVGCQKCAGPKYRELLKSTEKSRLTKKEFLRRCIKAHGHKYDYSLVDYKNNLKKIKIICPIHGVFEQVPDNHFRGHGCQKCYLEKSSAVLVESTRKKSEQVGKDFIKKAERIHAGKNYDYSQVVYEKWDKPVKIICPIHGPFYQTPNNHKAGAGCNICSLGGFNPQKAGTLYYLRIVSNQFGYPLYKIGITNRTVEDRYRGCDLKKITTIKTWEYPLGEDAFKMERKIINLYKNHLYQGVPPLNGVGISEIFVDDVLSLDGEVCY